MCGFPKKMNFMIYSYSYNVTVSKNMYVKLPVVFTRHKRTETLSNIFSNLSIKYVSLISFRFKLILFTYTPEKPS